LISYKIEREKREMVIQQQQLDLKLKFFGGEMVKKRDVGGEIVKKRDADIH
jgi:hypothetical protein